MQVVAFLEVPAQLAGQQGGDGGLPAAGDTHEDQDGLLI
jgi:hypothetical protein